MPGTRRRFLASTLAFPAFAGSRLATPSARQIRWHGIEFYGFLHFSINTFTNREWGYGDENPALFNPTDFDAGQIVGALRAAGMKGVILTCKHHDGFCLWPTKTTSHNIAQSPFRGGKGDIVREISDAARTAGMGFGVYLSPWDRNNAAYGKPEYIGIYRAQLRELLTGYGDIFEVWHDGANGGDGYYGGAREKRKIDKTTYYDWPATWQMVRELQPQAVIFSDVGPDIRWVGNEKGRAPETSWSTFDPVGEKGGAASPGDVDTRQSGSGTRGGQRWLPAECDVSIRPGWFWHEKENLAVKKAADLRELYFQSVGHGASFLLNVPPDRRGRIHENDSAVLQQFGEYLRATFSRPVATARGIHLAIPEGESFNVIRIREDIRQGQRVEGFELKGRSGSGWRQLGGGTTIGNSRLIRLEKAVSASELRLEITGQIARPVISELAVFREPQI